MPFTLIGACEATPGTGTVNVAFPQDRHYSRLDVADSIKITAKANKLLGLLYIAASTGARALLHQPVGPDKSFIKCALQEDLDPNQGWHDHFKVPVELDVDKLQARSVNATDEATLIGMMLGDGFLDPRPFTIDEIIDGYSDTTATALTWSDCAITWNQDLKEGKYSVVGMRASLFKAANPMIGLARLSGPSFTDWQPGVPCVVAEADHEEYQSITHEPWAIWGDIGATFKAPEEMPNIQLLQCTAPTDENVQLMLKKVA